MCPVFPPPLSPKTSTGPLKHLPGTGPEIELSSPLPPTARVKKASGILEPDAYLRTVWAWSCLRHASITIQSIWRLGKVREDVRLFPGIGR